MKKIRFPALFLLAVLTWSLIAPPAAALEQLDLQCGRAVLLDANYGEVLFSKGAYEKAYPASITKVMTALLVLEAIEDGRLTQETAVTASETAVQLPKEASTQGIRAGEVLTVKDLLYCLLLPSANEAANILAEAVDGTMEDFVDHMNRKAAELGCKSTHFCNANGLHEDEHYSTAYDISLYMNAALEYDLFRTIIGTPSYTVPETNLHSERYFFNTNGLISNLYYSNYVYDKCIGGKTGTTDEAGRCLVAAAEDGDTLLISVILGSGPIKEEGYEKLRQGQFTESTKLLKWGFSNFRRVTITREGEPVAKVAVTMSRDADEVNLEPRGSITRTLPIDMDLDNIQEEITLFSDTVEAPVAEGQVLGTMKLSYEGEVYGVLDLVAVTSVERSELLYQKAQFLDFIRRSGPAILLAAAMLAAAVILLRLLVFQKRRRPAGAGSRLRGNYRGGRR